MPTPADSRCATIDYWAPNFVLVRPIASAASAILEGAERNAPVADGIAAAAVAERFLTLVIQRTLGGAFALDHLLT